jgi:ethanolamine utilization protein EutQ (cupin superfamily)
MVKKQGQADIPNTVPPTIQKMKIDLEKKPNRKLKLPTGNAFLYPDSIFCKSSFAAMEHFPAGETMSWTFDSDEWQLILKGEAELTYSLAASMHTEQHTMHLAPGDLYLIPAGSRLTWKVSHGDPLLHLCVVLLLVPPREPGVPYVAPGTLEYLE